MLWSDAILHTTRCNSAMACLLPCGSEFTLAGLMPGYGRGVSISAVVMDYYKVCFGQMQFCILRDAILQWRTFSHAHPNLPWRVLPALTKMPDRPATQRPKGKPNIVRKKPYAKTNSI